MLQAQQLVIVTPPSCSLLACTDHPISSMVHQTPSVAPLKLQQSPAVAHLKFKSSLGPSLPVGSARRSFLSPTPFRRTSPDQHSSNVDPPISNCPLFLNPISSTHFSLSSLYKQEDSSLEQSHSNSFSNPGGPSSYHLQPPALGKFDWPTTLNFSSTQPQKKQEKEQKKGPNLERVRKLTLMASSLCITFGQVAYVLSHDLLNMFLKSQEWEMYHPNMVLQDNIRGKR